MTIELLEKMKNKSLNSDRIELAFGIGTYGVKVLFQANDLRVSSLYTKHKKQEVMRTLAIVNFATPIHPLLQHAHKEITEQNGSIGTVLNKWGWKINKKAIYFGEIPLSKQVMQWMQEDTHTRAAIHIYQLEVEIKGSGSIVYCTICEIHSPQFLKFDALKYLYEESAAKHLEVTEVTKCLLSQVQKCMCVLIPFPIQHNACFFQQLKTLNSVSSGSSTLRTAPMDLLNTLSRVDVPRSRL